MRHRATKTLWLVATVAFGGSSLLLHLRSVDVSSTSQFGTDVLHLEAARHELIVPPSGLQLSHEFCVKAPFVSRPVTLRQSVRSCGCLKVTPTVLDVGPENEGIVTLYVSLGAETTARRLAAQYESGDSQLRRVEIQLDVTTFAPLTIAPTSAVESEASDDGPPAFEFRATVAYKKGSEPPRLSVKQGESVIAVDEVAPTERQSLNSIELLTRSVRVRPTGLVSRDEHGVSTARFEFVSGGMTVPRVVRWRERRLVAPIPKRIWVRGKAGDNLTREVRLTSTVPFRVLGVTSSMENVTVEDKEGDTDPMNATLEVLFNLRKTSTGQICVELDVNEREQIQIPVYMLCE